RRCAAASRIFRARSTAVAGFVSVDPIDAPIRKSYRLIIEYVFSILNIRWPARCALDTRRGTKSEHMFNMLNTYSGKGKNPPMVCKILDRVSAYPHDIPMACGTLFYLLEGMG